jgi:hypothetical protein
MTLRELLRTLRGLFEYSSGNRYVAAVLDDSSHRALLDWWRHHVPSPLLPQVVAHHCTLAFGPTNAEIESYPLEQEVVLRVIGWAADEQAGAVAVASPVPSKSSVPHVTVSLTPGTTAVYSNKLLAKGFTRAAGPALRAQVKLVMRG